MMRLMALVEMSQKNGTSFSSVELDQILDDAAVFFTKEAFALIEALVKQARRAK